MAKLNPDIVERLILEEGDPQELRRKLIGLINAAHPVNPPFVDGEQTTLHSFVERFKKHYCAGNETRFWQWPVTVSIEPEGWLSIELVKRGESR